MGLQVGFMAVTARILTPSDFGAYGAALVLVGLAAVFTSESIGLSVVLQSRLSEFELRWLASVALAGGTLLSGGLWLAAPYWAGLWGVAEASPLIRVMVVSVLPMPYLALLVGMARRTGRLGHYASAFTAVGSASTVVALVVMLYRPSPLVLALAPVLTPFALMVTQKWWLGLVVFPGRRAAGLRGHVKIAGRDWGAQVLDFTIVNAGAWSVGFGCGPGVLGMWNRASTLSQAPMMMLRSSISDSLLEGHRSRPVQVPSHTKRVPDFSIQLAVLGGAMTAPLLFVATPLLLGPQWVESGQLAVPLALYMGLLVASTRGTVELRTQGRQRLLGSLWIISAIPLMAGISATLAFGDPEWVAWAYVAQGLLLLGLIEWNRERGMGRTVYLVAHRTCWIIGMLFGGLLITGGLAFADLPVLLSVPITIAGITICVFLAYLGGLVALLRRLISRGAHS